MNLLKKIEKEINGAILNEPLLRRAIIKVVIDDDRVFITGVVDQYRKKYIAEQIAKKIAHPKTVMVKLEVVPLVHHNDDSITDDIMNRLSLNFGFSSDKIITTVKKGIVKLQGEVSWSYQKDLAFQAICVIEGIRDIRNNITVSSYSNELLIKKQILHDLPMVTPHKIDITINQNKVTLSGTVSNEQEKKAISEVVGKIPGIGGIRNKIYVRSN